MAGSVHCGPAPYPNGPLTIVLGRFSLASNDTGAQFVKVAAFKAPYDFLVKKARMNVRKSSLAITTSPQTFALKIEDDTAVTPQTIVASRNFVAADDDDGYPVALTVADEGPVLAGGVLYLYAMNGTGDVIKDVKVELDIEPVMAARKTLEH